MPAPRARPTRDAEPQPLTVLDLDAPELGLRPEDQFASVPPGRRLIPRRQHDESSSAPLLLLAGLVVFFVVGAWLGGADSDEDDRGAPDGPQPALMQSTGTALVLLGDAGVAALDVDRAAVTPARAPGFDTLARDVAGHAAVVPSAASGRVWIATAEPAGTSVVREVDLADGSTTVPALRVEGSVVGALTQGVLVEAPGGGLELVGADGARVRELGAGRMFLAARGDVLATRPADCDGAACTVIVDNLATGTAYELRAELGAAGTELASMSPDGRQLAVLRSDGVETRGILVDLRLDTVTPFGGRAALQGPSGAPTLAWSPEGDWLFVATVRGGLDAVARDGQTYRVEAELPPFTGIVTG